MSKVKVISFENYCPDTDRHTDDRVLSMDH